MYPFVNKGIKVIEILQSVGIFIENPVKMPLILFLLWLRQVAMKQALKKCFDQGQFNHLNGAQPGFHYIDSA